MFTTLKLADMEPGSRPDDPDSKKETEMPLSGHKQPAPPLQPRQRLKSKLGCLTCKARRKKCDETRPVCFDCLRFKKECVWIEKDMSLREIRRLRSEVTQKVKMTQMRTRRPNKKRAPEQENVPDHPNIPFEGTESSTMPLKQPQAAQQAEVPQAKIGKPDQQPTLSQHGTAQPNLLAKQEASAPKPKLDLPLLLFGSLLVSPALSAYDSIAHCEEPRPLLTFLKDLSLFHQEREHSDDTAHEGRGQEVMQIEPLDDEGGFVLSSAASPAFNVPNFMENIHLLKQASPQNLNSLASSFNAAFSPRPQVNLSILPDLNETGQFLYSYYVNTLSAKVCIAPSSQDHSNSYQKVFLPLAHKDNGVLYGILAWAGFHLGGKWLTEGSKYAELAVKLLTRDVDFLSNSHIANDRRTILNKMATILILCGAEICRGDVKYWSVYLNWGWKLLRDNGGILNFDNNKEEHWLISNFAYHDLLASSASERGTYFPVDTYNTIFADAEGVSRGLLDPLLGVCKSLFKMIGEISSLSYESKIALDNYYHRSRETHLETGNLSRENVAQSPDGPMHYFASESETSEHGQTNRLLSSILLRAQNLRQSIDSAKPEMAELMDMSDADLELQLTCFEAYQLSATLYLRQSIMKCNPSELESQIIVNDLVKCLEILLDSPMEATLVFPVFMAGIHLVTEVDRDAMRGRVDKMIATYGPWNVVRVRHLMEKVWEANPGGDRVVDWHAILKSLGWDLNFA